MRLYKIVEEITSQYDELFQKLLSKCDCCNVQAIQTRKSIGFKL